jgi:hypothetical protein
MARIKKSDEEKAVAARAPFVNFQGQPLYCGDCGLPQWTSPGGVTCDNGHGGAASMSEAEARARYPLRPEWAASSPEKAAFLDEMTKELAKAIVEEGEKENAERVVEERRGPLDWGRANKSREAPADPAFERITETLVVNDTESAYKRLEQTLVIGDKRTDYGSVMKALDEAESNARLAHRLWQTAIVERKRWEMENEVVWAAGRSEANRSLQHEKNEGTRSKMITDADVESRIATLYPDQWRAQEMRRIKMKSMVDSMQNLAENWASRCKSLQVILSKQR